MHFSQSLAYISLFLWSLGVGLLGLGILAAGVVLVLNKFPYKRSTQTIALLSIQISLASICCFVWLAIPHEDRFQHTAHLTGEIEQDGQAGPYGALRLLVWSYELPPASYFTQQSPILAKASDVLDFLDKNRIWLSFFDWLGARISYTLPYSATYSLRIKTVMQDIQGSTLALPAAERLPSASSNAALDMATVTLTSKDMAKGVFVDWPTKAFDIRCTGGKESAVQVRPHSPWIYDVNLKEHETLTIPETCYSNANAPMEVAVSVSRIDVVANARIVIRGLLAKNDPRLPHILAYAQTAALKPGESLALKISAKQAVDIEIFRLGRVNELMFSKKSVPAQLQPVSMLSFRDGANWEDSYKLQIPLTWRPGYYAAKISSGTKSFYTYFLVSHAPGTATPPIAILASTYTWQAYNSWGGGSFYYLAVGKAIGERQAHRIHLQRPMNLGSPYVGGVGGIMQSETNIAKWLEASGYDFSVYTDSDLHSQPALLSGHKLLVIPSHSEYWTDEMVAAVERHLSAGGSVAYLGGNAIYNRVTIKNNVMEGYNHRQYHEHDGKLGGFFYLLGRPQSSILGVQYDSVGFNTFAPYSVKNSNHWVFAETGLSNGDQFGRGSCGGKVCFASGHELDKMTPHSPKGTVLLATGLNPGKGADMTIYTHPGGGLVYSVGSISYSYTLNMDRRQGQILKNVISRAGVVPASK